MGYDMQWTKDGEREGYFRLNIWGMGTMRDAMYHAMAISEVTMPEPPPYPDELKALDEANGGEGVDEDHPASVAYEAKLDEWRATPGPDARPPGYKFCSNDGWEVSATEAATMAERLQKWLDAQPKGAVLISFFGDTLLDDGGDKPWRAYIQEWIDYNRKCAAEGTSYRVW